MLKPLLARCAACCVAVVVVAAAYSGAVAAATPADQLVTGPKRGTYFRIGHDLSRLVAAPAGIALTVLPSMGSVDNVRRLRSDAGVRLALVQSDVYQSFLDEASSGSDEAAHLVKPLRVVMPLHDEELHFVVRADSPLEFVHDIKDKRINIGPLGSGTALTVTTVYRQMFGSAISEKSASFLSSEDALLALASGRSIDVAVVVAGQPARLFANMRHEARRYVKLLKLDPEAEASRAARATYLTSVIRAASYPSWLSVDVAALSVRSLLVTYDFRTAATRQMLTRFSESLCANFDRLRSEGHAKWQDVQVGPRPLSSGWNYYAPTERVLAHCSATRAGLRPARAAGN